MQTDQVNTSLQIFKHRRQYCQRKWSSWLSTLISIWGVHWCVSLHQVWKKLFHICLNLSHFSSSSVQSLFIFFWWNRLFFEYQQTTWVWNSVDKQHTKFYQNWLQTSQVTVKNRLTSFLPLTPPIPHKMEVNLILSIKIGKLLWRLFSCQIWQKLLHKHLNTSPHLSFWFSQYSSIYFTWLRNVIFVRDRNGCMP